MPKKEKPAEPDPRTRILDAALALFAEHGYDATSMRTLGRAVGMRESSLYNHFDSKAAILFALADQYGSAMSADRLETDAFRRLANDPATFCRRYIAHSLEQWGDVKEQQFQAVMAQERNRSQELHRNYYDQLFGRKQQLLEEYFKGFADAGLIETDDPRATAKLFLAGMTHLRFEYFMLKQPGQSSGAASRAGKQFTSHFLKLIKAKQ